MVVRQGGDIEIDRVYSGSKSSIPHTNKRITHYRWHKKNPKGWDKIPDYFLRAHCVLVIQYCGHSDEYKNKQEIYSNIPHLMIFES